MASHSEHSPEGEPEAEPGHESTSPFLAAAEKWVETIQRLKPKELEGIIEQESLTSILRAQVSTARELAELVRQGQSVYVLDFTRRFFVKLVDDFSSTKEAQTRHPTVSIENITSYLGEVLEETFRLPAEREQELLNKLEPAGYTADDLREILSFLSNLDRMGVGDWLREEGKLSAEELAQIPDMVQKLLAETPAVESSVTSPNRSLGKKRGKEMRQLAGRLQERGEGVLKFAGRLWGQPESKTRKFLLFSFLLGGAAFYLFHLGLRRMILGKSKKN